MVATLPLVLYTSLLEIFIGTFAVLVLTDFRGEMGRGFLASVGLTALGIAICAQLSLSGINFDPGQATYQGVDLAWNGFQATMMTVSLVLIGLYNLMIGIGTDKARRVVGVVAVVACVITLFSVAMLYRGNYLGGFIAPFSFFFGSLSVGAVMTGMLLGHWYLVTPSLTVAPLARINLIFLGALLGQLALALFNSFPWTGQTLAFNPDWALLYWLRVLVGIIFPIVLSVATIQTCKLKAHMSSTGFLYVALGCVLAGQIISRHVLFQTFIPL